MHTQPNDFSQRLHYRETHESDAIPTKGGLHKYIFLPSGWMRLTGLTSAIKYANLPRKKMPPMLKKKSRSVSVARNNCQIKLNATVSCNVLGFSPVGNTLFLKNSVLSEFQVHLMKFTTMAKYFQRRKIIKIPISQEGNRVHFHEN